MTRWECVTHKITLTIEGNKGTFETPPGSIKGLPPCKLLTMPQPTEGRHGECEIVKEK
ncbi:hypothetical protein ES703_50132 [subsurface metagenome]